ncbi:Hypothetical predicted protein [Octopus vulgaris]|uniref:Uncharacterized protein n=1 Tax=Octopus vulgaris TaxID=6645 RepID=A0AA36ASC5_OCTVU|nr:Hypothetical predicted protein [Octopus vulgaris]
MTLSEFDDVIIYTEVIDDGEDAILFIEEGVKILDIIHIRSNLYLPTQTMAALQPSNENGYNKYSFYTAKDSMEKVVPRPLNGRDQ